MAKLRQWQQKSIKRGMLTARALAALALAWVGVACSAGSSTDTAASTSGLTYGGPTSWTITGPEGGPFANSSMNFLLENHAAQPVDWTASTVPAYLVLDRQSGTIAANSNTTIHAALNGAMAQQLSPGNSPAVLTFHNETGGEADVVVDCNLSISAPGVQINLAPGADFTSSGPAGGPFAPASTVYTLMNTGTVNLSWQATGADAWVTAAPGSGQLAPNASTDITVTIADGPTTGLVPGLFWSSVEFTDASNGSVLDSRDVLLNINTGSVAGGWTTFTPSADTRMVYVSQSQGNDSNDGLSPTTPKRTVAAGKALMRNNYPDWLLLRCGDVWDEAIGTWGLSGRSITEPILISSYGTGERPFLRTGTAEAIVPAYLTNPNFVNIVGLHFKPHLYTGNNGAPKGVNWIRHTTGFLLEDCFIERYWQNVVVQGFNETNGNLPPNRHTDVRIRRNVIAEAYSTNNVGTIVNIGIYVEKCDGVLIEENVFDHNGWVDSIPGSQPTWFRHNGYVQNGNTGVILRGNIIAGTDAVMMRAGGVVENNLYLHNYNAILFGLGIDPEPAGVSGTIRNNVVLDGRNYGDGAGNYLAGGLCLDMGNVNSALVDNNIFSHNTSGNGPRPIQIHDIHQYNSWRVVENTTFSNNIIYDWGGNSIDINTGTGGLNQQPVNLQLINNIFENGRDNAPLVRHTVSASLAGVSVSQGNNFNSIASANSWFSVGGAGQSLAQWKAALSPDDTSSTSGAYSFPDPNRTIATYQAMLGDTATLTGFMAQARLQGRNNWRTQYTADAVNTYIRAGFGR